MAAIGRDWFAATGLPNLDLFIISSAGNETTIGRPGNGLHIGRVPGVGENQFARRDIPDLDALQVGERDLLAIRGPGQREYRALSGKSQPDKVGTGQRIPDAYACSISFRYTGAIRRPGNSINPVFRLKGIERFPFA